jgi:hypothetical protein
MDPDPDPYWSPASTSGSGSGKNEYGSETLAGTSTVPIWNYCTSNKLPVELLKDRAIGVQITHNSCRYIF